MCILRVEETDLYHNASLAGLDDEILQTRKELRIPFVEVELVSSVQSKRLVNGLAITIRT